VVRAPRFIRARRDIRERRVRSCCEAASRSAPVSVAARIIDPIRAPAAPSTSSLCLPPTAASAGYWTLPAPVVGLARPMYVAVPGRVVVRPQKRPRWYELGAGRAGWCPGVHERRAGHPAHPARLPRIPAGTSTIPTHRHSSSSLAHTAPTPALTTLSSRRRAFTSHTLSPTVFKPFSTQKGKRSVVAWCA
jgi:hypothetical protein